MINEENVKRFCGEDPTLIENYWDAMNDEIQVWDCHHKNEIFRGIPVSRAVLKDIGLYWGCPADELIFLPKIEHRRLHNKNRSEYTKKRMSEAHKGKHHNEETKRKMSEAQKERLNSEDTKRKMRKPKSDETKMKMSEAQKGRWQKMRAKQ